MSRTKYAFTVLQATALVASLAVILWSLGFPTLQFAQAANVTTFSNTLSDSAPSVVSDHLIEFVTPTGVVDGETIVFTYDAAFTGIASLGVEDVDLIVDGSDETVVAGAPGAGQWGVTFTATTITFTSNGVTVGADDSVVVEIGLNAASGDTQITNPSVAGVSYEINVAAGSADSGETRVAIVDSVTVTATVDTIFTFTVAGTPAGTDVNGILADETGGATTATTIPFGELEADTASTAAQVLEVDTNAANGFVVTVTADQQLTSSNGADIDGFIDGAFTSTPAAWTLDGATVGQEETYGHWGLTSNDTGLVDGLTDLYVGGTLFVSASSTPVEVFRENGPTDAATAEVLYKVEITALQEAADDYTATLTYVATPVF